MRSSCYMPAHQKKQDTLVGEPSQEGPVPSLRIGDTNTPCESLGIDESLYLRPMLILDPHMP